jgi:hypothetical protein
MQWVGVGFHTDASVAGVETGEHLSVVVTWKEMTVSAA